LSAEILTQDIKGTFDNTMTLLVRYELTDHGVAQASCPGAR